MAEGGWIKRSLSKFVAGGAAAAGLAATVPAAVLLLSTGSAGAAGTQVRDAGTPGGRQSPAVVVEWHKLHLIHGWAEAAGPKFPVGNAAYSVINGVVYLTGGIKHASGKSAEFTVLPKAARPEHYVYLSVVTGGINAGGVEIWPSGEVFAYEGGAAAYTSLDAISYPAAGTRWHKLALTKYWQSDQRPFDTGDPAYAVRGDIVYLGGAAKAKSSVGEGIATLPPGARPSRNLYVRTYTSGASGLAAGALLIHPDGTILVFGGNSRQFLSLAGISFPNSKFKWHPIALSGWQSVQSLDGTGHPAYGVAGPIIYLGGAMRWTTGSIVFAATPASIRPRHELNIGVYTFNASYGQVQVTKPSLYAESVPASNAQDFTSLAGISYPISS